MKQSLQVQHCAKWWQQRQTRAALDAVHLHQHATVSHCNNPHVSLTRSLFKRGGLDFSFKTGGLDVFIETGGLGFSKKRDGRFSAIRGIGTPISEHVFSNKSNSLA